MPKKKEEITGKITLYPDKVLERKIKREAKKQRRFVNSFILTVLEEYFKNE